MEIKEEGKMIRGTEAAKKVADANYKVQYIWGRGRGEYVNETHMDGGGCTELNMCPKNCAEASSPSPSPSPSPSSQSAMHGVEDSEQDVESTEGREDACKMDAELHTIELKNRSGNEGTDIENRPDTYLHNESYYLRASLCSISSW